MTVQGGLSTNQDRSKTNKLTFEVRFLSLNSKGELCALKSCRRN